MASYLFILSISGLIALTSAVYNIEKYRTFLILLLFITTSLFIGLRHEEIGPDWFTYKELFLNMENFNFLHSISIGDPAYFGIMWILRYLGFDVVSMNILFSVMTVGFYVKFCSEQKFSYLAFFVGLPFLIIYTMNFPRQAIAMVIGGYALFHALNNERVRALIWILIAVLFHKTAIIYLVFLFDNIKKLKLKNIILISAFGLLFFYLFIFSHLQGYIHNFSILMQSNAAHLKGIVYLLPVLTYLVFYKNIQPTFNTTESTIINRFCIICIISYAALFSSSFLYNAIDRIYVYFLPFEIMIFATYIARAVKRDQMIIYISSLVIYKFLLLYLWLEFSYNSIHFIPYSIHNI